VSHKVKEFILPKQIDIGFFFFSEALLKLLLIKYWYDWSNTTEKEFHLS